MIGDLPTFERVALSLGQSLGLFVLLLTDPALREQAARVGGLQPAE